MQYLSEANHEAPAELAVDRPACSRERADAISSLTLALVDMCPTGSVAGEPAVAGGDPPAAQPPVRGCLMLAHAIERTVWAALQPAGVTMYCVGWNGVLRRLAAMGRTMGVPSDDVTSSRVTALHTSLAEWSQRLATAASGTTQLMLGTDNGLAVCGALAPAVSAALEEASRLAVLLRLPLERESLAPDGSDVATTAAAAPLEGGVVGE